MPTGQCNCSFGAQIGREVTTLMWSPSADGRACPRRNWRKQLTMTAREMASPWEQPPHDPLIGV